MLEDLIKLCKLINGQCLSFIRVPNLVSLLPLWMGRTLCLTGSRLYFLSLPSFPHIQMSKISSWLIPPTCRRIPVSYEWLFWVPRMQESQHSLISCWAEKYATSLTIPFLPFPQHTLFISPCILLKGPRTSLGTSLFLSGVSCLQEGAHYSLPGSGGHHRGRGSGGGYLQQDRE